MADGLLFSLLYDHFLTSLSLLKTNFEKINFWPFFVSPGACPISLCLLQNKYLKSPFFGLLHKNAYSFTSFTFAHNSLISLSLSLSLSLSHTHSFHLSTFFTSLPLSLLLLSAFFLLSKLYLLESIFQHIGQTDTQTHTLSLSLYHTHAHM